MKLYDFKAAPNPRRARIFIAEKGLEIATEQVDLGSGEQFQDAFRAVNPRCTVPVLELDDGTRITEAVAICRYLEELHPEPPLFGRDALERARVTTWEQRVLLDGLQAVAEAFRNHVRGFKDRALPGPDDYAQIPELVPRGRARALKFWEELDGELASREFIACDAFSMADINALVMVDFAGWIKLELPEELMHLKRWHAAVAARPSAQA
ncbi:MAG: glutathione S-transferase [Alphaproteobacteria bacterium]|nr:glutathione S-transferase [Alphaproteobacteria bacterium]